MKSWTQKRCSTKERGPCEESLKAEAFRPTKDGRVGSFGHLKVWQLESKCQVVGTFKK